MNEFDIDDLQTVADKICKHFKMDALLLRLNRRLKRCDGFYRRGCIDMRPVAVSGSLLCHELAHHLKKTRFDQRIEGYYKVEMWPMMVLNSIDENSQRWYAAKGELHPVYSRLGTAHDKRFQACLDNIEKYVRRRGFFRDC